MYGWIHFPQDKALTAELVSSSVSRLARFDTGLQHPYYHLAVPGHSLNDISVLCNYCHLQKLELPHNNITDLSCVSHMPFLTILDASHNKISDFFGFQAPKNLKDVNFSHNCLTQMKDLSDYPTLMKLDLNHNKLTEVMGLEKCCKLTDLDLAYNNISSISSLDAVPLTHLNLRGNQLKGTEGLENLKNLQVLDLAKNHITNLSGLQNLHMLGFINLDENEISEIEECKHIHDLLLLRELNLLGNPVQEQPQYRLSVIFLLQHLTMLDQKRVTVEEKVTSINKYDPPMEVVAARDHMTQLMYQLMQPQLLYDSTLPSDDAPYPMLVLTGPQGCGKRELAHRLCQDFDEYFAYGIGHTTREPYFGEENGNDYHFVNEEEFQQLVLSGAFLQTVQYGGHRYGLSREAIEDVAKEGLACCVHMELEGVLSLKKSIFEPRYIVLLPTLREKYRNTLGTRNLYTPAQIETAVSRIDLYTDFNRKRPGFFDNVIPCDDLNDAYLVLEEVVKDYLLLNDREEGEVHKEEQPRSGFATSSHPSTAALDPSLPRYKNYCTKIREQLAPSKTPAELASIRRREQPAREAVVGKSPGVNSRFIRSSCESLVSSASSWPRGGDVLGLTVETLKSDKPWQALEATAVTVPPTDRLPGSSIKPILPPIPPGRKTPQANSPMPSPSRLHDAIRAEDKANIQA
ncbi:leucine-rich repeat and guanylate kinase domain-containing protein [Nerophis ophidion]|uniref:leucine-rich repeat and guanylate kinase domain-containing protein n=1 Tax=Nerophis ophidion TaxID=159077 RepID=UPI002AE083F1|nr:leucine-rich repeat and guanylate kinase domain-containing protein [Nerophis ophidion]